MNILYYPCTQQHHFGSHSADFVTKDAPANTSEQDGTNQSPLVAQTDAIENSLSERIFGCINAAWQSFDRVSKPSESNDIQCLLLNAKATLLFIRERSDRVLLCGEAAYLKDATLGLARLEKMYTWCKGVMSREGLVWSEGADGYCFDNDIYTFTGKTENPAFSTFLKAILALTERDSQHVYNEIFENLGSLGYQTYDAFEIACSNLDAFLFEGANRKFGYFLSIH